MNTVDSGHFLLSVVNKAEDISLFLGAYNACLADDVLRSNIELDERPIVILGTEKRHAMCKKKLPIKFKEAKLEYNEKQVFYLTNETLKDFVEQAMEKLKDGEVITVEEETQSHIELEEPSIRLIEHTSPAEEQAEVENEKEDEEVVTYTTEKIESSEAPGIEEPIVNSEAQTRSVGYCKYGVPKLEVAYIAPDVIGLQESLFVNVDEETVSQFFQSMRDKVLSSIDKNN